MRHFRYDFAHILTKLGIQQSINAYLDLYREHCRIYLDEYEVEEVNLRVCFDTSIIMKKFMEKQ
jgi:hypothetical protein